MFAVVFAVICLDGCNRGGSTASHVDEQDPITKIFFITIDTLRADHVGAYGYPRPVSPFIDELAKNGALFKHALSVISHTAPSHASMFTSKYPFQHKVLRNHETLDPSIYNLYTYLSEQQFQSRSFTAVRFLKGKVGFPFEPEWQDPVSGESKERIPAIVKGKGVVNYALRWLEERRDDEKLFAWVHLFDVHEWQRVGRAIEPHYRRMQRSGDDAFLDFLKKNHNTSIEFFGGKEKTLAAINSYDARILYVDEQISRLHQLAEQRGWLKNSLWIILSDHGEGLSNHNYGGHGEFLYNEQLHIPLIVYAPGRPQWNRTINEMVRTVDLFPTIAEALGKPLDRVQRGIEGVSLVPLLRTGKWADEAVTYSYAERRPKDYVSFRKSWEEGEVFAMQTPKEKLIDHSQAPDELYDLANDPFETKNILADRQSSESRLRALLEKTVNRSVLGEERDPHHDQNLAPDEVEELKTLGYM
jgi:arylsulfatase A-like enzyme